MLHLLWVESSCLSPFIDERNLCHQQASRRDCLLQPVCLCRAPPLPSPPRGRVAVSRRNWTRSERWGFLWLHFCSQMRSIIFRRRGYSMLLIGIQKTLQVLQCSHLLCKRPCVSWYSVIGPEWLPSDGSRLFLLLALGPSFWVSRQNKTRTLGWFFFHFWIWK